MSCQVDSKTTPIVLNRNPVALPAASKAGTHRGNLEVFCFSCGESAAARRRDRRETTL
jgi:hypothetical protein